MEPISLSVSTATCVKHMRGLGGPPFDSALEYVRAGESMSEKRNSGATPGLGHNGGPPIEIHARTIFRVVNANKAYTKISNVLLDDKAISFECKGFLVSILKLPLDWQFYVTWLQKEFGVGRDKAYGLVKEATERGYCRRVVVRRAAGQVTRHEYHFADDPADLLTSREQLLAEKPEVVDQAPAPERSEPLRGFQEVAAQSATSGRNHFRPEPHPAEAISGKAAHIQRKKQDKELSITNSPPLPRRGAREREKLIAILRADGRNRFIVDHLIEPLLAVTIKHDEPVALLAALRDDSAFIDYPRHVLGEIANHVVRTRKKIISPKCVLDAINPALKSCQQLVITPDSESWNAWMQHYRATGRSTDYFARERRIVVYSEWPPGHARHSSEATGGRVA
jgi:hypothetical protein